MAIFLQEVQEEEFLSKIRAIVEEVVGKREHEPDQLLSRREAAKLLQVSLPTIRQWELQKRIKPKRIGKKVYFLKSALMKEA